MVRAEDFDELSRVAQGPQRNSIKNSAPLRELIFFPLTRLMHTDAPHRHPIQKLVPQDDRMKQHRA